MSKSTAKSEPPDHREYAVRAEVIGRFFSPPLASSTFHDLVNKGRITPMKGMRGFYLLNDSLRRLGLRELSELPQATGSPSLEDIVRLAFTLIDRDLFPEPSWLLHVEGIDLKNADQAERCADLHRENVESLGSIKLKLAYFQGVLDSVSMIEAEGE